MSTSLIQTGYPALIFLDRGMLILFYPFNLTRKNDIMRDKLGDNKINVEFNISNFLLKVKW